ncbi:MAG: helix-turn-helix transcriptional regulator [Gammaproteobacteria bacterium]|nr:helix-turn-helix transcriptional regulator [Gammaproteobacteria bacterium]
MSSRTQAITLETFNSLVASIYDAALDESLWINVTEKLARSTYSKSALMRIQNINTRQVKASYTYGIDLEYKRLYSEYYAQMDPLIPTVFEKPGYMMQLAVDTPPGFKKSEFYHDYARPQESENMLGGLIIKAGENIGLVGIQRREKEGIFEKQEYDLLKLLMPHLNRAFNINQYLTQFRSHATSARNILDRLTTGVILVNQSGQPQYINSQAEYTLSNFSGIKFGPSGIQFPRLSDTNALQASIKKVSRVNSIGGDTLTVVNPAYHEAINIIVLPVSEVRNLGLDINMSSITAVLFIDTGENSDTKISEKVLMDIYKLTRAEARLSAALAGGKTLEKIAENFNLSQQTLRSQLKSCFKKTDTKRQAELVKLLLSGPSSLIRDEEL